MNGAFGDNDVEIRPTGIKSALRFWWRSLNGHLPLDDDNNQAVQHGIGLRTREGDLFGNTKKRSNILVRVVETFQNDAIESTVLLPHRGPSSNKVKSLKKETNFSVRIDYNEKLISRDKMISLFVLMCTLGGLGKRSRRGFGSVTVLRIGDNDYSSPTSLDDIFRCINNVSPDKYKNENGRITVNFSSFNEYPFILEVNIGDTIQTLELIGKATHDTKLINPFEYEKSIGAGRPRLASPIYISILSNGYPVVTTLKKDRNVSTDLQKSLKTKILTK